MFVFFIFIDGSIGTTPRSLSSTSTSGDHSTLPVSSVRSTPILSGKIESLPKDSNINTLSDNMSHLVPVVQDTPSVVEVQDDVEHDRISEARALVYWWQRPATGEELEFCLHQTECKVKVSFFIIPKFNQNIFWYLNRLKLSC